MKNLLLLIIILINVGCGNIKIQTRTYKITDVDLNPLEKVKLVGKIEKTDFDGTTIDINQESDITGNIVIINELGMGMTAPYSCLSAQITKEGYEGVIQITKEENTLYYINTSLNRNYILYKNINDYYKKDILNNENFKTDINKFIKTNSSKNYILNYRSIGESNFKENNYITLKVTNNIVYNNLKLNKYEIGSIIYDEVVKQILNQLISTNVINLEYFGFDICVIGYSKSFLEKNAIPSEIEYRFVMSKKDILNLKNNNITSQEFLKNSYILMDNERIELKLQ